MSSSISNLVSQTSNEEFSIPCFPESEELGPSSEELEFLYIAIENDSIPELQWQFPGRRAPSPVNKEEPKKENIEKETPAKNDFDFMDDIAVPTIRVRNHSSTPKSAKKKTANFAGVIDALKKQMMSNKD